MVLPTSRKFRRVVRGGGGVVVDMDEGESLVGKPEEIVDTVVVANTLLVKDTMAKGGLFLLQSSQPWLSRTLCMVTW